MSQDLFVFSLFQRKRGKVNYRGKCFVRDSLSICFHWYQYSTLLRALPGSVLREWYQNLVPISNEMKWSLKSDSFCSFIYSGVLGCTAATSWVWQWPFPGGWGILQDSIMHSSLCEGLFFYWWEIRISQSRLLEIVVAFFQFFFLLVWVLQAKHHQWATLRASRSLIYFTSCSPLSATSRRSPWLLSAALRSSVHLPGEEKLSHPWHHWLCWWIPGHCTE